MELGGEDVIGPHRRGEGFAILGFSGNDGRVGRFRKEAVDKINEAAVGNALVQGAVGFGYLQLIPTNLGDFETGSLIKANNWAFEDAKPTGTAIEFLTALKESLVTNTNPQEGFARFDKIPGAFE